MKLKIIFMFFHTLLVVSSAGKVKEGDSHSNSASEDLSELQHTVSILEDSVGHINETVQEQQKLLRTISDSIASFRGELSNVGTRLTQLENMQSTPSTSHCGGRLMGESGVISYKEFEMYAVKESCTWIIEVPEAHKIGFKLEKSGLGRCCSIVNVTSLDTDGLVQQTSAKIKLYHTVFVDGPNAMVRFESDRSRIGLGFRLSYYKATDLNSSAESITESECGGVIVGETGAISYKYEESYFNPERCVWLVHSPTSTSITFHLRQAGFEKYYDFVSVTTIDPETGTLRNDTRLLSKHNETVTIQESTAVVLFSSDGIVSGTGFFLTFSANGVITNPKYVYKLRHIGEPNATIQYSASDRNDDELTKQHIYVTATSARGDGVPSKKFISGIDLNEGIFLRANDSSCVYDSLTFYEPIPPAVLQHHDRIPSHNWQKKAQIPSKNDTLLCPEKFSVPKQMALLEFDVHSFLAIYKPISKDTFESNAVVSFDYYNKPYKCGEIVQPLEGEFGIISYKENEIYADLEECSWIIEVTNATQIDFNLEQNGFQDCCDYVQVVSLDMEDEYQGPWLRLRAGSPTASVIGSRAHVNFKSNEYNVGTGFRLRYEKGKPLDENICGEVLNPMLNDFGVIIYKPNENYERNENCHWIIEAPGWERIGFTLEQSGFQPCCDFVTVSSATASGIATGQRFKLKYSKRNASVKGPNALVRFTSHWSGTGTGFRLRYEKLPALEHHDAQ
ncbi:unnamed protein product [Orchesella dallaii]|uniref:CUB domain-containing protein n=1 Tax=Orchesella dallaii TaxID=48710 RepID=A0ABP1RH54_9HEXA